MKLELRCIWIMLTLALVMGCSASPTPTAVPPAASPAPPTPTPTPLPTLAPVPVATLLPPVESPLAATGTVCAVGCEFTTIQDAIDDPTTGNGAIIEVADSVHTEAGIVVNKHVTIRGLGAANTIVQAYEEPGEAPERVFLVEEGATVILEGMTIRHGRPSVQEECGGGIRNSGTLTLKSCVVTDNIANGGGGICNRGPGELTLINCTVSGNTADGIAPYSFQCGSGGGITSGGKSLTLISTTVSGNRAGINKVTSDPRPRSLGGGVHIGCNCTAVFANTTISGNQAFRDGGGISIHGTLQLVNCTISDNTTFGKGGGVYVRGPLDYLKTIIANNAGKEGDCAIVSDFMGTGSIGTNRHNLVGDSTCSPDFSGDPMLGPLADNGGATWTHALLAGSPAVDAIPVDDWTLPIDQCGNPRPSVQTSAGTPCDIGAFECQP
jgi:hypothetical protein